VTVDARLLAAFYAEVGATVALAAHLESTGDQDLRRAVVVQHAWEASR